MLTNTKADKLQRLEDTVSAAYRTNPNPQDHNHHLLIDLGLFWEILEYSSSSEVAPSSSIFGSSLQRDGRSNENVEVSNASILPEPTRLDDASHSDSVVQEPLGDILNDTDISGLGFRTESTDRQRPSSHEGFVYSDDELAVLAENFFQQRGGNIVRSVDDWWQTGNL
jgi:hypothetical protein